MADLESFKVMIDARAEEEFEGASLVDGELEIIENAATGDNRSECKRAPKWVLTDDEGLRDLRENGESVESSVKYELVDGTAVVQTAFASKVGNGCGKGKGILSFSMNSESNSYMNSVKKTTDEKKEKQSRRRGRGVKNMLGTIGKEKILLYISDVKKICVKEGDKTVYSREVMEALRFVDLEAQKNKWTEVYCGLGPNVAREYDGLLACDYQKQAHLKFDPRKQFGKKECTPQVVSEDFSEIMDHGIKSMNLLDPACVHSLSSEDARSFKHDECSEDDSDEDYSSIQRPAFLVTGEPDFESGPPQDGLEYLRRVRWEAARIPKVKVAELERSKLNKEQTVYMPKIPEIAKCPEHLVPLKQWEDAFLADFSELRLVLSGFDASSTEFSGKYQFPEEQNSDKLLENIVVAEFDNLSSAGVNLSEILHAASAEATSMSTTNENLTLENPSPKSAGSGSYGGSPTLSAILRMDSVARLSMLRKQIGLFENASTLSSNDCAWLFVLCAAVDTPLDADTCAALRCLLRKTASLRAEKREMDDEVIMLNILATITGRFFGQSEHKQ